MYYYGGGSCGCCNNNWWGSPWGNNWGSPWGGFGNSSNYAIVLVLFILLVIVIGSRIAR